jgi:uncharacterized membrane protein
MSTSLDERVFEQLEEMYFIFKKNISTEGKKDWMMIMPNGLSLCLMTNLMIIYYFYFYFISAH